MSLHINRFIDRVQAAESKGEANIILPVAEAKRLHSEITKLLLALCELQEKSTENPNRTIEVEVKGADF